MKKVWNKPQVPKQYFSYCWQKV